MIIKRLIYLSIVFALVSCTTKKWEGDRHVPEDLYDFATHYDREQRAFILYIKSGSEEEICISRMSWTDENGGHYFFGESDIYFTNHGVRYPIKDMASGYCTSPSTNGCVNVLKYKDHIYGKIAIEDFVVSPEIYLSDDFDPHLNYERPFSFCTSKIDLL